MRRGFTCTSARTPRTIAAHARTSVLYLQAYTPVPGDFGATLIASECSYGSMGPSSASESPSGSAAVGRAGSGLDSVRRCGGAGSEGGRCAFGKRWQR